MTSILALKRKISRKKFKCSSLGNQKLFINFLLHLWNLYQIFNVLKKKIRLKAQVFPKLLTPIFLAYQCFKDYILGDTLTINLSTSRKNTVKMSAVLLFNRFIFVGKTSQKTWVLVTS